MNPKLIRMFIFYSIVLFSCTEEKENPHLSVINIKNFETCIEFKYIEFVPREIKISHSDSGYPIYIQDIKSRKTFKYNLTNDTILYKSLSETKLSNYFFETFLKTDDSIYLLKLDTKNIGLLNRNGDVIRNYVIDTIYDPIIFPPADLEFKNNCFIIGNVSNSIGFGYKKDRFKYYETVRPILLAKISDTKLHCLAIGKFPENYITTGDNYKDNLPAACIGKDGNICVSFGADNNLTLYHNSNQILKKEVKSKFIDKFIPYPDEKLFDMLYLKNYWAEEPKYTNIIFDPFVNMYYRVVKHRQNKSEKGNKLNTWSVIILDTDLNTLGEVRFNSEYRLGIFIPTPFGVILAKSNSKYCNKAILSLIKIKKNEK
ncbi:MAG: DUF4221 family protein [Bacteroidales bacterium]|nr:DUF4221 family protein [Bacteroidales bacterium]